MNPGRLLVDRIDEHDGARFQTQKQDLRLFVRVYVAYEIVFAQPLLPVMMNSALSLSVTMVTPFVLRPGLSITFHPIGLSAGLAKIGTDKKATFTPHFQGHVVANLPATRIISKD
jgi:hypothetical protein